MGGRRVVGGLMRVAAAAAKHGVVKVVSTKVAYHYRSHSAIGGRARL